MPTRIATPEVYTTREFAALHEVTPTRIRYLTRRGRVWPYRRTARGDYLFFGNTVVIRPALRPGRRLEKIQPTTAKEAEDHAARIIRESRFFHSLEDPNEPL